MDLGRLPPRKNLDFRTETQVLLACAAGPRPTPDLAASPRRRALAAICDRVCCGGFDCFLKHTGDAADAQIRAAYVIAWCYCNERAMLAAHPTAVDRALQVLTAAPAARIAALQRAPSTCRTHAAFGLSFAVGAASARPKFACAQTGPELEPDALLHDQNLRWTDSPAPRTPLAINATGLNLTPDQPNVQAARLMLGKRFYSKSSGQGEHIAARICRTSGGAVGAAAWLEADIGCGSAVAFKLEHAELLMRVLIADCIGIADDPRIANEAFLRERTDDIWECVVRKMTNRKTNRKPAKHAGKRIARVVAVPVTQNKDRYMHTVNAMLRLALDLARSDAVAM